VSWQKRIAWQEGMFLRAQHFQQQDRWILSQLRASTASLCPFPWGLTECAISRDLLSVGRFGLTVARGIFPDGTPFSLPDEAPLPSSLALSETARDVVVYLCIPMQLPGSVEVGHDGHAGRYDVLTFEAHDTQSGGVGAAPLQVGQLRSRLLLGTDDREDFVSLPIARISETLSDGRVLLDERWIAPVLHCAASAPLGSLLIELTGLFNQRADALAGRLTATGARSSTEIADFMLLQAINGWQAQLSHLSDSGSLHPEHLFRSLLQMAGELATFTQRSRRPGRFPSYRHNDLQGSFTPVVNDIRRALSAVLEQTAVLIPLEERRHGVRVGPINDRTLLTGTSLVLVVTAQMPAEKLRREFPGTAKVGAVEHIRELVNVALPGIELRALPVAPRQMPFVPGAQYFELDRNSPHWQHMGNSGGFAVHVSGDFPGLTVELWAIRA
jgi:type VI secretion system protein ImpJ